MESWIIYALFWALFIWTSNFYLKVVAEKWVSKVRVSFYSSVIQTLLPLWYLFYAWEYQSFWLLLFILMVLRIIFATEKGLLKIESLKYIQTNVFFPLHNIIQIFASFTIGMFIFEEYITFYQGCWIVVWIFMIVLLTSEKKEERPIDFKKGIVLLISANAALVVSSSINKYVMHKEFDIGTYLFVSGMIGSAYLFVSKKESYKDQDMHQRNTEIRIGVVKGLLTTLGFCWILLALREWSFVGVQMIVTFSIIIPIVLSTIFYKEQVTLKKIWALVLFVWVVYLMSM